MKRVPAKRYSIVSQRKTCKKQLLFDVGRGIHKFDHLNHNNEWQGIKDQGKLEESNADKAAKIVPTPNQYPSYHNLCTPRPATVGQHQRSPIRLEETPQKRTSNQQTFKGRRQMKWRKEFYVLGWSFFFTSPPHQQVVTYRL